MTSALDQEISAYEKQLRQCYSNKDAIMWDLDSLDYDDKHYKRRKADLDDRLYRTYYNGFRNCHGISLLLSEFR